MGIPFKGDYVLLRNNAKYKKIYSSTSDQFIVFADIMSKVNRNNGKVSQGFLLDLHISVNRKISRGFLLNVHISLNSGKVSQGFLLNVHVSLNSGKVSPVFC